PADRNGIWWRSRVQGSGDRVQEARVRVGREVHTLADLWHDATDDLNVERDLAVSGVRIARVAIVRAVHRNFGDERRVQARMLDIGATESAAELDDVDRAPGSIAGRKVVERCNLGRRERSRCGDIRELSKARP